MQLLGGESRYQPLGRPYPRAAPVSSAAARRDELPGAAAHCSRFRQTQSATSANGCFWIPKRPGLAGGTGTYAFLVGLAWWEEDGFVVEQYFMRDHGEEPSLLLEVLERLDQRRVLVTFNGKSFDWPLLQTRFQMTRMGAVRNLWLIWICSIRLARSGACASNRSL